MSHSVKKSPAGGITCCESEKSWKQLCNSRVRVAFRSRELALDNKTLGYGPKDGKQWYRHPDRKVMGK